MLTTILILGSLGFLLGAILAYASIKFQVEVNPLLEKLENALPGTNCGACGYAGCSGYAAALLNEDAPLVACAAGGKETLQKLSELLGKEPAEKKLKKVAFVFCQGGKLAEDKFIYSGMQTCQAAVLVTGGQKSCTYGCLGFGDCVTACQFDAIKLNDNNIPEIDLNKCINCGACIKACPKGIIKEVPLKESKNVICSSKDQGKTARKVCKVACIGCGICQKVCPFNAIKIIDNLAVIDREKCTNCGLCQEKCPTKAIA